MSTQTTHGTLAQVADASVAITAQTVASLIRDGHDPSLIAALRKSAASSHDPHKRTEHP